MWRQCDTSFFYSLVELSKSHIFPSPFSPAFTRVIGHFAASLGQVGCLLPWPDPCCCCNGDSVSTSSLGAFPHSFLRRELLWTQLRGRKSVEIWLLSVAMVSFKYYYTYPSFQLQNNSFQINILHLWSASICDKKNNHPKCRLGGKCWIKNNLKKIISSE